jgi:predicted nucleotidyltransferase
MDKERIEILSELKMFIRKHMVEKALLFGSFARGEQREDSDIDLILVSKQFEGKSAFKRPVRFYMDWHLGYPVDFLCYTQKNSMISGSRSAS